MNNNTYQNTAYPRKSPSRYEEPEKPALSKRLIEAFLTQLTICALIIGGVFGAHLLKLPNINEGVAKVKTIITYSPSLREIAAEAKDGASALMGRMNPSNKEVNQNETPMIIVDDEIF